MNVLSDLEGFAPIAEGEPRILILGTMPGTASLQKRQYYGHSRNAFWPIMAELFGGGAGDSYPLRKQKLIENGVAVWDVLQGCQRQGSLDANISMKSIRLNNFAEFFDRYGRIERVFFNGGMAEAVYTRYILPDMALRLKALEYVRLPSTSPANASFNFKEKLEAWRVIKQSVVK
ncbi:MAG: DNA-deoxyinosine glycosylase [Gammaproteobacteria bacterium]